MGKEIWERTSDKHRVGNTDKCQEIGIQFPDNNQSEWTFRHLNLVKNENSYATVVRCTYP